MPSPRILACACLAALMFALPACRKKKAPLLRSEQNAWSVITPEAAGFDAARLKAFSDPLGGNGVIARKESLVYTWGKADGSVDVASASKPVLVHFLMKAVQDGKVAGIDDLVSKWEPALAGLNPELDHKDGRMTWRHLMDQTSGYGLVEPPGAAFAYNDYQTQLFWDVLFGKVYGCKPEEVTDKVLQPRLFDLLGAQDKPYYRIRAAPQVSGRLVVSARDFARFGCAYMHGGVWQGRRIIDQKWVDLALGTSIPLSLPRTSGKEAAMLPGARTCGGTRDQEDNLGGYGFMWWRNKPDARGRLLWPDAPADTVGAIGHGGLKVLILFPGLDTVVAWNSVRLERKEMCAGGRDQINDALKRFLAARR